MTIPLASRAALLAALFGWMAVPATAQVAPATACTHDECALRVEPDATGFGVRLVRGAEGTPVGRVAAFRSDLSGLVAGSEPAFELAERAERSQVRALGAALGAGVLLWTLTDGAPLDRGTDVRAGVALAAGGALLYGIREMVRANRLTSRAVWEYNRGLGR